MVLFDGGLIPVLPKWESVDADHLIGGANGPRRHLISIKYRETYWSPTGQIPQLD